MSELPTPQPKRRKKVPRKQALRKISEAKTWDDLIEFTEAKIAEMQDSLKTFRRNKETGRPLPGMQSSSQLQDRQHSV